MGFFSSKKEGGLMDVIRCDQPEDYLIWKWSPGGEKSRKEDAIRYGSSLRVKDGEVAVFVYKQANGVMQDFIEGPYDQTIQTTNFPVLTSIVGSAFGGASPFQAEIYFINLAGNIQMRFAYKDVTMMDPRAREYKVPAMVKGSVTFNITNYREFIKKYKLVPLLTTTDLIGKIADPLKSNISTLVGGSAKRLNISIFEVDLSMMEISSTVQEQLKVQVEELYGFNVLQVNITEIKLNEEHKDYLSLAKIFRGRAEMVADEQVAATARDIEDQRQLNLDLRARANEEMQRAQKLQTETSFIGAHQLNIQGDVAKTAAQSLGQLGGSGSGFGGGMGGDGGLNPAGMMTGMMMGAAVGQGMSNMMGNMMNQVNTPQPPPPPPGAVAEFHIVNSTGAQCGPYTIVQLKQMILNGELTLETYVWKQGMATWTFAKDQPDVKVLFGTVPPPPPPMPGL